LTNYYLLTTTNWSPIWGGCATMPSPVQYHFSLENRAITITRYTGSDGAVIIPNSIAGFPVTNISDSAFTNCSSVSQVTIPDSITRISSAMFKTVPILPASWSPPISPASETKRLLTV
jgi:hypothetical protein